MRSPKTAKVALVHDYLLQYGGAEKVLESLCHLFPEAPIYTGAYNPAKMSEIINSHKIISPTGVFSKFPKLLTFLMPFVFENFDLREFDVVISEGTAWPKGVLTTPDQVHISYIHTPPRFLYGYSVESAKRNDWYFKPIVSVIDHFLRIWDYEAAQRPDFLIANSQEIQKRIKKFYGRESTLIYPPVDVDFGDPSLIPPKDAPAQYFLACGRLVAYKNFDLLIKAFAQLPEINLVIIGTGREEGRLSAMAPKNVTFAGRVDEATKHAYFEHCQGFINPVADEDLGITPIEAQAHGKPVLAHKSGGHLETITEGVTGMFFEDLAPEKLAQSIRDFAQKIEGGGFNSATAKQKVQKYGKSRFEKEMESFVQRKS